MAPTIEQGGIGESNPGITREAMLQGIDTLSKLTAEQSRALLAFVSRSGGRPSYAYSTEDAVDQIGLKGLELASALSLASVVVVAMARAGQDAPAILSQFEQLLGTEKSIGQFREFFDIAVEGRSEHRRALRRAELANQILPTVSEFYAAIDVRLRMGPHKFALAVPVAIAQISTDLDDQYLRFQMTQEQAEKLAKEIGAVAEQLAKAEALMLGANDADIQ